MPRDLIIETQKELLKSKLKEWFNKTRNHLIDVPAIPADQVRLLSKIRLDLYEDLNQIQHEAALIAVAETLQAEFQPDCWKWHPRQTSHPNEADLTGFKNGNDIVNVEVTTSLYPKGVIDSRMRKTLESIDKKAGNCFYYVLSDEMFRRAETKKKKCKLQNVKIRQL